MYVLYLYVYPASWHIEEGAEMLHNSKQSILNELLQIRVGP